MANTDRARKLMVRTALTTSTTIATLVGAQSLAMLDAHDSQTPVPSPAQVNEPTNEAVVVMPTATEILMPAATDTSVPVARVAPEINILHVAPSITVLRQPEDVNVQLPEPEQASMTVIQPPAPVELAAPEPVIVQGEAPPPIIIQQAAPAPSTASQPQSQRSRSSR